MTRYHMTITKADERWDAVPDSAQTILRVRTEGGRTFMEEISVRAPAGSELIPDQELLADLGRLIRAFSEGADGGRTAAIGLPGQPRVTPSAVGPVRGRERGAGEAPSLSAAAEEGARGTVVPAERAYRRMPDVAALLEAYEQTRTITGVAEHFGVPRHTAQGWITRLRRRGIAIGDSVG